MVHAPYWDDDTIRYMAPDFKVQLVLKVSGCGAFQGAGIRDVGVSGLEAVVALYLLGQRSVSHLHVGNLHYIIYIYMFMYPWGST